MDLLGPVGAGATWKLINNQLAAGQMAALAEALAVAKKAGFKDEQISDLIPGGARRVSTRGAKAGRRKAMKGLLAALWLAAATAAAADDAKVVPLLSKVWIASPWPRGLSCEERSCIRAEIR